MAIDKAGKLRKQQASLDVVSDAMKKLEALKTRVDLVILVVLLQIFLYLVVK